MAVWSQVKVCGRRLSLRPIDYARSVCDTENSAAAAVCGLWHYISVICLCLTFGLCFLDASLRGGPAWARSIKGGRGRGRAAHTVIGNSQIHRSTSDGWSY